MSRCKTVEVAERGFLFSGVSEVWDFLIFFLII